jgi:hypothetical protein
MTDLQKFPNAMIPAWRSGDTGTVAPSGATFLTGSQWESWNGALAVAFLKDSRVRVMFLDGNGAVSFATPILALGVRLRSAGARARRQPLSVDRRRRRQRRHLEGDAELAMRAPLRA